VKSAMPRSNGPLVSCSTPTTVAGAVDRNRPPEHRRIAAESPRPEWNGQHGDLVPRLSSRDRTDVEEAR
jgi:hypothetical protein